jgi:hypothetical protein
MGYLGEEGSGTIGESGSLWRSRQQRSVDNISTYAIHITGLAELQKVQDMMSLLDRIGRCEGSLGRYKATEVAHQQHLKRRDEVLGRSTHTY